MAVSLCYSIQLSWSFVHELLFSDFPLVGGCINVQYWINGLGWQGVLYAEMEGYTDHFRMDYLRK